VRRQPWQWGAQRGAPVILQDEAGECALACLAMVLGGVGHQVDLSVLRSREAVSSRGANLNTLMQLAGREGLSARPLRLEPEELGSLRLPAILHWDLNHFVVLAARKGARWVIHDPALGQRVFDNTELGRHFTGVALELTPTADFRPREERRRLRLRELWRGGTGLWPALGQILLLSLLLQCFVLALPFYTQLFIDDALVHGDASLLVMLASGFLLVTLAQSLTEYLRATVVLYLGSSIGLQFATSLGRHLLQLPLHWFARRHLGDVVSRFASLNQVRDFLSSGLVEVLIDGLMVLGTLGLMGIYSLKLTLVAIVAVFCYTLARLGMHHRLLLATQEQIHAGALENSLFMENVRAIQGIRLAGKEDQRLTLWQNRHVDTLNAGIRTRRIGIVMKFAHGMLSGTENIVLMLLGGFAVLEQELSIGMLMAYIGFKDQCYARVFALIDKVCDYRMLVLHLERLADIALSAPEARGTALVETMAPAHAGPCLALRGLGYRHDAQSPWLFRDVALELGEDEMVAIVGPSGCGKSTLLRVVTSLLEAAQGDLCLDGTPLAQLGLERYRRRVAGVMQDDVLLAGSIFDNITFFDPLPDRAWVLQVAAQAAIAADIQAMPMQYETLVGGMGAALSGGQIQRLLLARALYRRPRLLVLDEATSHLDLATERQVNQALRQLRIARLIVAHRPASILLADRIFALTSNGLQPLSRERFGHPPALPDTGGRYGL